MSACLASSAVKPISTMRKMALSAVLAAALGVAAAASMACWNGCCALARLRCAGRNDVGDAGEEGSAGRGRDADEEDEEWCEWCALPVGGWYAVG